MSTSFFVPLIVRVRRILNKRPHTYGGLYTLLILFMWSGPAYGQNFVISEGFSDQNLSRNPTWTGNTSHFSIIKRNQNYLLQLNDSSFSGEAYLSTPIAHYHGRWDMYTELLFAPSSQNRIDFFLAADTPNLAGTPSGYAVQGGEKGNRDIFRLVYMEKGNVVDTLIEDHLDLSAGGNFTISITHEPEGRWSMSTGRNYGKSLHPLPSATHHTSRDLSHFGLRAHYTKTRSNKFYFDFKIDPPALTLDSLHVANSNDIKITFNQPLDTVKTQRQDFNIQSRGNPTSLNWLNQQTVLLNYEDSLPSGGHQIAINPPTPLFGEGASVNIQKKFYHFDSLKTLADVVLNEFHPAPPSNIPEYIEIFNTSHKWYNASNWLIGDEQKLTSITNQLILPVKPKAYLVFTPDTAKLIEAFGPGPYVQVSSWAALNNGGDAIRLFNNAAQPIDSLTYTSAWLESDRAVERRSSSAPTRLISNWAPSLNHRGSPGQPNTLTPDRTVPGLNRISYNDDQEIRLHFSEPVHTQPFPTVMRLTSIDNKEEYSWQLNDSVRPFEQIVSIDLLHPVYSDHQYRIEIDSISDAYHNVNTDIDTTFTYYHTARADSGTVYISEFMYDPEPSETEYIELYNASDHGIDLSTLLIGDKSGSPVPLSTDTHIFPPRSYMVIVPGNNFHSLNPQVKLDAFPTLNNSGDAIMLYRQKDTLMDSLFYVPLWGGSGRALERRSFLTPSTYISNWSTGKGPESGTPGRPNRVKPDTSAPSLQQSEILHHRALRFHFSEPLLDHDINVYSDIRISPHVESNRAMVSDSTLLLFLQEPLEKGVSYQVTLQNISDPFENVISDTTATIRYIPTEWAQKKDIVINELYLTNARKYPPFVELYNRSQKTISLHEWKLGSKREEIPLTANRNNELTLKPEQYLLISTAPYPLDNQYQPPEFPHYSSYEDNIVLRNSTGKTIDSLTYKRNWLPQKTSLERKDPYGPSADPYNWEGSITKRSHSAGGRNSTFEPDTLPPQLQFSHLIDSTHILLNFNEFVAPSPQTEFQIDGQSIVIDTTSAFTQNQLILRTPESLYPRKRRIIQIKDLSDRKGNKKTSDYSQALAYFPEHHDLIFTEILFDPIRDKYDGRPNQSEYAEFYNRTEFPLYLKNVTLRNQADENSNKKIKTFSHGSSIIGPKSYGIILGDTSDTFEQAMLYQYFNLSSQISYLQLNAHSLSLNNERDSLFLTTPDEGDIASLYYQKQWHTESSAQTKGLALERIQLTAAPSNSTLWGTSAAKKGGTPGRPNTILQQQPDRTESSRFVLTPNPFSPDGDSFEDHLIISYDFNNADQLMDVVIYDRYGRSVRTLSEDNLSGTSGQLVWDGMNNAGQPCRIGPYIILIETYDPITKKIRKFKKTAVIARQL